MFRGLVPFDSFGRRDGFAAVERPNSTADFPIRSRVKFPAPGASFEESNQKWKGREPMFVLLVILAVLAWAVVEVQ